LGSTGTRIQLCGRFLVEIEGRRLDEALPGRQGRLLFGYLVVVRPRPTRREVLTELLWPGRPPEAGDASLRPLLSRMRRVLGEQLQGRSELGLDLPLDSHIDVEILGRRLHEAESAIALGRWEAAWMPAQIGWGITAREFLAGCDGEWVLGQRRAFEGDHLRALECIATAGLHLGASELPDGERAARSMIELAPYHESGYRLLMEVLEKRGEIAEALLVHDRLRRLLREELGVMPSGDIQAVHERLLARP
jgi:DNA-binding SARP family transcriptional activator